MRHLILAVLIIAGCGTDSTSLDRAADAAPESGHDAATDAASCEPRAQQCRGNTIMICTGDGQWFDNFYLCSFGCLDGICVGSDAAADDATDGSVTADATSSDAADGSTGLATFTPDACDPNSPPGTCEQPFCRPATVRCFPAPDAAQICNARGAWEDYDGGGCP